LVYEYTISRSAILSAVFCPDLTQQLIDEGTNEENNNSPSKEKIESMMRVHTTPKKLLPDNLFDRNPFSEQLRYGLHMALVHLGDLELANNVSLILSLSFSICLICSKEISKISFSFSSFIFLLND
jgi:hypothetical protein